VTSLILCRFSEECLSSLGKALGKCWSTKEPASLRKPVPHQWASYPIPRYLGCQHIQPLLLRATQASTDLQALH
jgi:hypothetical protein